MPPRPALSAVIQQLENGGVRVTAPRLAVLAAAADAGDQFSADEIAQRLPRVGRATVFRTLKLLVGMDVFCRVLLDDGDLRYRWSRRGHHHHLVCVECGAIEDFMSCDVSQQVQSVTERINFKVEGHWLEVYGRCGACAAKSERVESRG